MVGFEPTASHPWGECSTAVLCAGPLSYTPCARFTPGRGVAGYYSPWFAESLVVLLSASVTVPGVAPVRQVCDVVLLAAVAAPNPYRVHSSSR